MTVSKELREQARQVPHHQRKALKIVGSGEDRCAGPMSLVALMQAGLIIAVGPGLTDLQLTDQGQALHDALSELGWFPP